MTEHDAMVAEIKSLRRDVTRLREAVNKIGRGEWLLGSWYDRTFTGNEFCWRVNVRDEPSKHPTSITYSGTEYVGVTPADAAIAAMDARPVEP